MHKDDPTMQCPAPRRRFINRLAVVTATLTGAAVLAACGGSDDRCSDASTLHLSLSWTVNGVVNQSFVQGRVGQPILADPVFTGLPASCAGHVSYRLDGGVLPPGLSLNASSGQISGTSSAPRYITSTIAIQVEGYREHDFPFRISIAP